MKPHEIRDSHHSHVALFGGTPKRTCSDTLLHHGVESLLQGHRGVQQHQLGVLVDDVVALVVFEEIEDVIIVNLSRIKGMYLGSSSDLISVENGCGERI